MCLGLNLKGVALRSNPLVDEDCESQACDADGSLCSSTGARDQLFQLLRSACLSDRTDSLRELHRTPVTFAVFLSKDGCVL